MTATVNGSSNKIDKNIEGSTFSVCIGLFNYIVFGPEKHARGPVITNFSLHVLHAWPRWYLSILTIEKRMHFRQKQKT